MLALYRRHRQNCKGNHAHNSRTSEYDERKKGWKRCECPIFVSGTLAQSFNRHNTGKWEWEDAQAAAAAFELCGNWNSKLPPPQQPSIPAVAMDGRVSIAEAVRAYLAGREGDKIAPATLRKYRTFTKQLSSFAESRGYVMIDQITASDIDLFYGGWTLGVRTKGKGLGKLRSFFRFCAKRKWVTMDITDPKSVGPVSSDLKPPLGASAIANKVPFTDDELKRILEACDKMEPVKWSNSLGQGVWTGEDVKDFILVMVYSGLRISDVAIFNMSRVHGNEVFLLHIPAVVVHGNSLSLEKFSHWHTPAHIMGGWSWKLRRESSAEPVATIAHVAPEKEPGRPDGKRSEPGFQLSLF